MTRIVKLLFVLLLIPICSSAQVKRWTGLLITQGFLNGKELSLNEISTIAIGIEKVSDGTLNLVLLEKNPQEQSVSVKSSGRLSVNQQRKTKYVVNSDYISALWSFDSFYNENDGTAEVIICSDKERNPALPKEVPPQCKGFWSIIKSNNVELKLNGIYICDTTDLEEMLK